MEEGKLYYSITEVSKELGVNSSLLRYWETEFDCIRPHKNKRGSRSYTLQDIELLRRIQHLTKDCGFTIDGAREQLRHNNTLDEKMQLVNSLNQIRTFLVDLKEML